MDVKRAFEGLTLVVVGFILLANTIGGLPWAVWISILSLWPLALVAAGIDIIGRSTRQTWVRVAASLVTVSALLYGAFVMTPGTWGFPLQIRSGTTAALGSYSFSEDRVSGVETGQARIVAGATRLTLAGGDPLASVDGATALDRKPSLSASNQGGVADVSVSMPEQAAVLAGAASGEHMDITLNRDVRWTRVTVDGGALDTDLDLTDLNVDRLTVNAGASSTRITVRSDGDLTSELNGGACAFTLRVPADADVTLRVNGFPVATSVPAGFDRQDGWFGSGTWHRAGTGANVRITVAAGAASVAVVDYRGGS